jgi:predicted nucleic acid-binding protein
VEVAGWFSTRVAVVRSEDPRVAAELQALVGDLYVCRIGELEQLYSATSGANYDHLKAELETSFYVVPSPPDILDRALALQSDLAHHRGMWHRTPIPDLLIAETALLHGFGVLHVDRDFERIAEVRPLAVRRLHTSS